jgi:phage-related protein
MIGRTRASGADDVTFGLKLRKRRFQMIDDRRKPVLDWLRTLVKEDRRIIGIDLMRVQFGWPIGMPLVRSLKDGLWEVRSSLASQRIARLLLCFQQETLVVLHGFIKKSQKTAPADLALAVRRMKEVMK